MMSIEMMMMWKRLKNGPNKLYVYSIIYYYFIKCEQSNYYSMLLLKIYEIIQVLGEGNDFDEIIDYNQFKRFHRSEHRFFFPFGILTKYIDEIAIKPLCLHVTYLKSQ